MATLSVAYSSDGGNSHHLGGSCSNNGYSVFSNTARSFVRARVYHFVNGMSCPTYIERLSPPIDNARLASISHGLRVYGLPGMGKTTLLRHLETLCQPDPALHPDWERRLPNTIGVYLGAGFTLTWPELLARILAGVDYTSPDGVVANRLAEVYRQAMWRFGDVALAADGQEPSTLPSAELPAEPLPNATAAERASLPGSPTGSLSWMGYFHHLHRQAPDLTILFLLDDLDEALAVLEAELDPTRVSPRHILLFGAAPNVKVVATTVHADFNPGIAGWFGNFSLEPLFPFELKDIERLIAQPMRSAASARDEATDSESIAKEILRLTGGIPELVCSLLTYFTPRGNKIELTSAGERTWLREYVQPWYERVRVNLPPYEQASLARVAEARKSYNVNSHNDRNEIAVLDLLAGRGLVSVKETSDVRHPRPEVKYWTYEFTSDGLRQLLSAGTPRREWLTRLNPFPFRPEKLYSYSLIALILSMISAPLLPLLGIENRLWSLLPLALLVGYAVIGFIRPSR